MAQDRVIGVIPARLGSERFPGKVLTPICGRPLIRHVYDRLCEARSVDRVLVATDSTEVESVVNGFGGSAVLVATPCATGSDRVAEAVRGMDCDVVVNLQGDQPLIDPVDIDRVVAALAADGTVDMTTLASPADDEEGFASPDVVKVVADGRGRALYFSREPIPHTRCTPAGNPLYLHHVGIYCFRREALGRFAGMRRGILEERESLEQLRALEGGLTIGLVVTRRNAPAVDRPDDVREVERLMISR
ncbi:MAG: 3-deoxy-manno-octulosonate cytidylyltransferase [Candidatus Eisenbacteria bacterium]|nr:3-deoxy-manno-octulosonate cytidylyltransferase [Candidatus Eisenbacteria bacterium]